MELLLEKTLCCGNKVCKSKIAQKRKAAKNMPRNIGMLAERFSDSVCDFCFVVVEKIHRCSQCRTKQYCSKQCLAQDFGQGHCEACPLLKGDRLREKGGKEERKERGGEAMDRLRDFLNTTELGGVMEAQRKDTEDVSEMMKNI